jgi:ketosteroid isomerase-like protein
VSRENVEVVLRLHAAFSRADLDGWIAGCHPEAEYRAAVTHAVEGEAGDFKGHDGLRRWWRDVHDLYDDLQTEVVEVRDFGERVVVVFIVSGRGRGSGIEDGQLLAQVVTVRQGKIVQIRDYLSRAEALEAAGLRE